MTAADDLHTIRDLVRFAVSRFTAAGVAYGHGTTDAVDEAAFLVLEALHLPVDDAAPWLDARLTRAERERLLGLIEARVATRTPAPYLVGRAYIQGIPFRADPRAIVPRSYLGELLARDDLFGSGGALVADPDAIGAVLDLCTGGGSLAILAARRFPAAVVDAVDLSADALALARDNVAEHGFVDRIALHHGDLFAPVAGRRYDLVLANPPYVDAAGMAALAPEVRHEPALALDGGPDGLAVVRRILDAVPAHLRPGGGLLCEIGRGRARLEAERDLPFVWLDTAESDGEVFWLPADPPHPEEAAQRPSRRARRPRSATPPRASP